MDLRLKKYNQVAVVLVFVLTPALLYVLGDFPRRSLLKESIALLTLGSFFIMLLQFYLSRANKTVLKNAHPMGKVVKWHRVLGYVFVSILLFHPILIVVPRYFEAGVDPQYAFMTLITTSGKGVVLGIIAWFLMLIIGITSAFRNKLGMKYKTWRIMHGILSILFIGIASFHVIDLGRHANLPMTILIMLITMLAITLQLKTYFADGILLKSKQHE